MVLSERDRREAASFGKKADLVESIIKDLERCGYVGEDMNKLVCYLAMSSRKMPNPLSIMIISGSGAGKRGFRILSLIFVLARIWSN
ncbi:MAG: hypothetical protein ACMUIP_02035 [bacterium]